MSKKTNVVKVMVVSRVVTPSCPSLQNMYSVPHTIRNADVRMLAMREGVMMRACHVCEAAIDGLGGRCIKI